MSSHTKGRKLSIGSKLIGDRICLSMENLHLSPDPTDDEICEIFGISQEELDHPQFVYYPGLNYITQRCQTINIGMPKVNLTYLTTELEASHLQFDKISDQMDYIYDEVDKKHCSRSSLIDMSYIRNELNSLSDWKSPITQLYVRGNYVFYTSDDHFLAPLKKDIFCDILDELNQITDKFEQKLLEKLGRHQYDGFSRVVVSGTRCDRELYINLYATIYIFDNKTGQTLISCENTEVKSFNIHELADIWSSEIGELKYIKLTDKLRVHVV